ncbi:hypothetical protein N7536_003222 [Penicillium majusculum]|nr:hypothetical protein N7536_003222 [Penicillium majusculum]
MRENNETIGARATDLGIVTTKLLLLLFEGLRKDWTKDTATYIEDNTAAKYQDFLVPKTAIGFKRRVITTDYLTCLHRDNVKLVHDDSIDHITNEAVMTIRPNYQGGRDYSRERV